MSDKSQEISIFEIFYILYKSKIVIIAFISLFTLIGYFYHKSLPITVYSEYNIKPISNLDKIKYDQFNSLNEFEISSDYLMQLFIDQINTYDDIQEAVINSKLIDRDNYNSTIEFEQAVRNNVLKFKLEKNLTSNDRDESDVKLIYTDTFVNLDKNLIISLIDQIILSANENVRKHIINEFNIKMKSIELNNNYQKREFHNNIENLEAEYLSESQSRLKFLKEQALIARHLGISNSINNENKVANITNIVSEGKINQIEKPSQYYLIGYMAIEKEIEIINERALSVPFLEEISYFKQRIKKIDQDNSVERAQSIFKLTPIALNDGFKSVQLNSIYHLKIKVISEFYKVLLIFLVSGFIISSTFIIFSYYINKKSYF